MYWKRIFIFLAFVFSADMTIAQETKDSAISDYMLCVRRAAIRA